MLQKLMLAGNRLDTLPDSLAGAPNLELLRIAANRFEALPPWLAALPRLAWTAWAGNPFERAARCPAPACRPSPGRRWSWATPSARVRPGGCRRPAGVGSPSR